jgi:hypothetical protein
MLQPLYQGFSHRIRLAEELKNALMIEGGQLAVLSPLQRRAVQLIHLKDPALIHGKERHGGPPAATIG